MTQKISATILDMTGVPAGAYLQNVMGDATWGQLQVNLASQISGKLPLSALSTSAGTPSATTYLRGDGTWATPVDLDFKGEWGQIAGTLANQVDLAAALAVLQPLDATLTGLAALDGSLGVIEQNGTDTFTKRTIGVGSASSLLTRADGDARFSASGHTHTLASLGLGSAATMASSAFAETGHTHLMSSVNGLVETLSLKENAVTAGATTEYYRGDKTWAALNRAAVGLGNVDNTSDSDKPISTATASALSGKLAVSHAGSRGSAHGDATAAESGFMTAAQKIKLDNIAIYATVNASDAELRDRTTHTGTQPSTTLTMGSGKILGRTSSNGGPVEEIIVSAGLLLAAGELSLAASISDISGLQGALDAKIDDSQISALGLTLLSYTSAAEVRTQLGLGSAALEAANSFAVAGHTHSMGDISGLTTTLAGKESSLGTGTITQYLRGDKTWQTLNKATIGLGDVDNTSDAAKPLSTAASTALAAKAPINNPIFTGSVRLPGDPVAALDAATKQYVDNIAQGITSKASVRAATTADIDLTGEQTIDGILTSTSRVLVKNQTDPAENGIYETGTGFWTRADDMDAWNEVPSAYVFVEAGTSNANTGWVCNVQSGGTLGTTPITWAQFSGANEYAASGGITKTGNEFTLAAMPAYTVKANATNAAATPTDVTLSALTGLLSLFTNSARGLVPASGGGTTSYLRADGQWAAIAPTAWGQISGSLVNQTDLSAAINAREPSITSGTTGQFWRGDKTWQTLTKGDVGLGAVENTSDLAKPISTATQAVLSNKLDVSHAGTGGSAHAAATTSSSGFMSSTDKAKLDGIATGATANSTDTFLRTRSNHTGTQDVSTVTMSGLGLVGSTTGGVGPLSLVMLGSGLSLSGGLLTSVTPAHTHTISDVTGLQAALDSKIAGSAAGTTGLTLLGSATASAARTTLGLGSAALSASTDFATAGHAHTMSSVTGLLTALADKQPLDGTLSALASLSSTAGLLEQTGVDTFVKRSIGVATSSDILSRGDADTRFAFISHAHPMSSVTGLETALDSKLNNSVAGAAGLAVLGGATASAIRSTLGLGSLALLNSADFASTVHSHAMSDVTGLSAALTALEDADIDQQAALDTLLSAHQALNTTVSGIDGELTTLEGTVTALQTTVSGKQPLDATLTALAGLDATLGILEQTGTDTFSKRAIGTGATNLLTRGDADTLFASLSHTHALSDVTGLTTALSGKEPALTAGTLTQYYRGDKTWATLNKGTVGLSNVDNTSDSNKPVSTATATALAGKLDVIEKGAANGLATLDGTGKIPTSQIPPLAISSSHVVNSEAAMLALTVQEGDIAIRTDVSKNFIRNGGTSGTLSDWNELQGGAGGVSSVNGQSGVVVLGKADIGLANVDNTSDANKPVSTAQQTALNLKAPLASPSFTGAATFNIGSNNFAISGNGVGDYTYTSSSDTAIFAIKSSTNNLLVQADPTFGGMSFWNAAYSAYSPFRLRAGVTTFEVDGTTRATVSATGLVVAGTVSATNLSGTNTGDQDLSSYATTSSVAAGYQPLDATLTALAGLNTTTGIIEQTGTDTFTKRGVGVTASTDLLTRGDGDGRYAALVHNHDSAYAALAHTHAMTDITGLSGALSAKLDSSAYTASDVLTKLLTVDGTGSGIDADLWDGNNFSAYLDQAVKTDSAVKFSRMVAGTGSGVHDTNYVGQATAADWGNGTTGLSGSLVGTTWDAGLGYGSLILRGSYNSSSSPVLILNGKGTATIASFASTGITFNYALDVANASGITVQGNTVWHANNDGAGSGLDADTVDGLHASSFQPLIAAGTSTQYWRGDKTWQTLDKVAVGLANVDNTSDASKPVSTAQQTALNAKISTSAATAFGLSVLGAADAAAATALFDSFTSTLKGLVPSPGGSTGRFLKDDGTWANLPTGVTTFQALTDVADFVAGDANKVVKVNGTGTGIDYGVVLGTAASQNSSFFALASHTHAIADVTGLQTALNAKLNSSAVSAFALTYLDETSAEGVRTVLELGSAATADAAAFAESVHTHAIADVTGLQTALNNKESSIASGSTAQYWRGDKSWQTLNKSAVGLGNVDNTSDANKPISSATQTALDTKAPLANPTFTGSVTLPGEPTLDLHAATKLYVDTVAQGLDAKSSVACATTANIILSGEQAIDGVTTSASRVLVKNQTATAANGIYVSAAGAWTRAADMNVWAEVPGAFVFVESGTINGSTGWVSNSASTGTLDTTAIVWSQFSGAGTYTASTGITLSGSNFSLSTMPTLTLKGNATGGTAAPTDLTATQAKTLLAITQSDVSGLTTALNAKADLAGASFTSGINVAGAITTTGASGGVQLSTRTTGNNWVAYNSGGTLSLSDTADRLQLTSTALTLTGTVNLSVGGSLTASNFSGSSSGTNTGDQTITLTGHVTGSGTGSFATTIANNVVTNAMLAQVGAFTFLGRASAGTGNVETLTNTQATALLNVFSSSLSGVAPASGGGTANFLRADGTWAAPPSAAWGSITGILSNQTDLSNALNAKAPLASPAFTGTVTSAKQIMGGFDSGGSVLAVGGSGGSLASFQSQSPANGASILSIVAGGTVGATVDAFIASGSNTGTWQATVQQNGAGNAAFLASAMAGGGDALIAWTNSTNMWSAGIDTSDSHKWKLSRYNSLGVNDAIAVDGSNNALFTGQVTSNAGFATASAAGAGAGTMMYSVPHTGDSLIFGRTGPTFVTQFGWRDADRNHIYSATEFRIGNSGGYTGISGGTVTATTFSGALSGNATTATTLQNARTINGTSFNGSANITITANTSSSLTFNNAGAGAASGTTFNGGSAATISYNTIGAEPAFANLSISKLPTIAAGTALANVSAGVAAPTAVTLTSSGTANTLVYRDASGNFSAATITAALSGNASTATTLQTARAINGVSFNGSAAITITAANPNAVTFNNGGAGAASGAAYDGSAASTISYNTIGAPSTTGTNASGTWGISITGNAATATSATSASSATTATTATTATNLTNFYVSTSTGNNPDTLNNNSVSYANSVSLFGQADGALYSQYYSASWQHQIFGDYRTGQIAIRGKNNGTWQSWRTVLDSSNYTSYSPSLTGSGASGTWGISINGNAATASNSTQLGGLALSAATAPGANQVLRSDASGYVNLGYINSNTATSENPVIGQVITLNSTDNFYRKSSIAHLTAAVQSNASGSWGINISGSSASCTGNAATATTASGVAWTNVSGRPTAVSAFTNDSGYVTSSGSVNSATTVTGSIASNVSVSGFLLFGNGSNSNLSGDHYKWGYQQAGAWASPNANGESYPDLILGYHTGIKIGASFNYGGVRFYNDHPNFSGTTNSGTEIFSVGNGDSNVRVVNTLYIGGNTALHGGNYTAYAPSLTGAGASGTWGISITGNAATATTASSANSVAWTNVSGRPTAVSAFTNDSGYQTSSGSVAYATNAGTVGGVAETAFMRRANNAWNSSAEGTARFFFSASSDTFLHIPAASNIYFQNSSGQNSLTCNHAGDLTMLGNVTAYSDLSLKTNIETIPNALDKVCGMRGVTFDRIDTRTKSSGVIAQEFEQQAPELVMEDDNGLKSVAYANAAGYFIEAIKELKGLVDEQRDMIENLKAEIAALKGE